MIFHTTVGWSLGYVSTVDSQGRAIWIADAHRDDGKRFVVRADEKLTAFAAPKRIGLKSHIRLSGVLVKVPSITSSDSFNLSSTRLNKPQGAGRSLGHRLARSPDPTGTPSQPKGGHCSKGLVRMVSRFRAQLDCS